MGYKDNFKSAFGEMFNSDGSSQNTDAAADETTQDEELVFIRDNNNGDASPSAPKEYPVTVISNVTTIQGKVTTEGHIDINGTIDGDVEAGGNIRIKGTVTGNVSGNKIEMISCVLNGNTTAKTDVVIDGGSNVTGDITADSLVANGKVKGNVTVENNVLLQSKASIKGDVTAKSLGVENGAAISGSISIPESN
ncbi:MAG: polymer-forming cytoskeletal protein [Synergistaceae bacterium]|nr:polymer-forming cytoskeletal protein [Synergistaceae bacterium]